MKFETIIAGALIATAIVWNGYQDRAYQSDAIRRCAAAYIDVGAAPESEARKLCLLKAVQGPLR